MDKKRLNVSHFINDLRAGLSNDMLREKFRLAPEEFGYVMRKLVEDGVIAEMDLYQRIQLSESSVTRAVYDVADDSQTCPYCGYRFWTGDGDCPMCKQAEVVLDFDQPQPDSQEVELKKRKISAKAILQDLEAGLKDVEIMNKHHLSRKELRNIYKKLVKSQLMSPEKMRWRQVFWDDETTIDLATLSIDIPTSSDKE